MKGSTPNRGGMICFNRAGEVLLVSALGKPNIWVFPKGHIKEGDDSWQTAEREVEEEARIHAVVDMSEPLGTTSYTLPPGEEVVVEWWTGLGVRESSSGDEVGWDFCDRYRTARWVRWETALELLSFSDHRNLLRRAICLPEIEEGGGIVTLTNPEEVD